MGSRPPAAGGGRGGPAARAVDHSAPRRHRRQVAEVTGSWRWVCPLLFFVNTAAPQSRHDTATVLEIRPPPAVFGDFGPALLLSGAIALMGTLVAWFVSLCEWPSCFRRLCTGGSCNDCIGLRL